MTPDVLPARPGAPAEVLVFDPTRRHNGDLIWDAARMGWLPEPVFDATYGLGRFWSEYKPDVLATNDLHTPAEFQWDWREPIPENTSQGVWGAVVFDPPFKEQGRPSDAYATMNTGYGVNVTRSKGDLHDMLSAGAVNCAELVRPGGYLLIKCMDQIVCGRFTSQTTMFQETIGALPGWGFESWLHLPMRSVRPQRSQRKPRNNYSTLLAFRRRR